MRPAPSPLPLVALLSLLSLAPAARADEAVLLSHQGYLLDATDAGANGTFTMTFGLYATPTGGAGDLVWSETYDVPVARGYFEITLGDTTNGKAALTRTHLASIRWLGVHVGSTDLIPRVRVAAAFRALVADDAHTLGGRPPGDYQLADASDTRFTAAEGRITTIEGTLGGLDGRFASLTSPVDVGTSLTGTGAPGQPLAVAYGTTAGTAAQGNDARLTNARTPTGSASGDLSGTYPGPTVARLQGRPVDATAPTDGQVLRWNQAAGAWQPATGAGGVGPAGLVTLTDAATIAFDGSLGSVYDVTLAGNRTIGTPTNLSNGTTYVLRVHQDATGNRTLAFATGWRTYGENTTVGTSPNAATFFGFHAEGGELHLVWFRRGASLCTSSSQTFDYTGATQPFTQPSGCFSLTVKAWGAGGAGGYDSDDWGGGGGYTQATLAVTPGDGFAVLVGGGGRCGVGGFGGGGDGGGSVYQGGGGGRSALRTAGGVELLTAGGGGGGSGTSGSRFGGGGGGATGQPGAGGDGNTGGSGATSGGPGAAGSSNNGGGAPQPGSAFLGGKGSVTGTTYGGGGGGGGYFGGGGGGGSGHASCCSGAGGGGGSGYVVATATAVQLLGASTATPANSTDTDRGGAGLGGPGTGCGGGAHGRVKLSWAP